MRNARNWTIASSGMSKILPMSSPGRSQGEPVCPRKEQATLSFQGWMIFRNPLFKDPDKLLCLGHDLGGLRFGSDESVVIVNDVPLPPTPVEIIAVRGCDFSNGELKN